ncbi:MAG: AraC family transcriptional regulator [Bacillota bacterium]|nr:AraC family transcriptional regulator [Bacillota bacterium]
MKDVKEQVAYLKGLIDGSDFLAKEGKERAVWERMLELFSAVAEGLEELKAGQKELEEYAEALDDDLAEIEEELYGEEEAGEDEFVEMECPHCKEAVRFAEDLLYEDDVEVTCPNCGEVVYASEPGGDGEDEAHPDETK